MPLEKTIDVVIESLGAQGDGVAWHEGAPLYVPRTVPQDQVQVRLITPQRAEPISFHERGVDFAPPACSHFGECGGCALQHLREEARCLWLRDTVVRALHPTGISESLITPVVATRPGGRRRATLTARKIRERVILGFNAAESRHIVDVQACPALMPSIVASLPKLREGLAPILKAGRSLDLSISSLDGGLDVLLIGPLDLTLATQEALAVLAHQADLARLSWAERPTGEAQTLLTRRPVRVVWNGVPVPVPPGVFLQASAEGEDILVSLVMEGVGRAGAVADLFAGCGTFSIPLAKRGARVMAMEASGVAVGALKVGAKQLPSLTVTRRNLVTDPLTAKELSGFEAVVFDPPRAGALHQVEVLAKSAVPVIVAVSCNPKSFARDAALLLAGGYVLQRVTPLDQFVWSPHIELVGFFSRLPYAKG